MTLELIIQHQTVPVKQHKQEASLQMKTQSVGVSQGKQGESTNQVVEQESTEEELKSWLSEIRLPELHSVLVELGADGIESLLDLEESDLKEKGIPPLKRRKLLREISKKLAYSKSTLDVDNKNANSTGLIALLINCVNA
jgi:hypothetical protein